MIDLDIRTNKFEREQQKRREDAKRKREREAREKREAEKREQELAELAAKRRAELELIAEERILQEQQELQLTGGVKFIHQLTPYCIDGEDDKVILPEDCLQQLSTQEAISSTIPMSFELSIPSIQKQQKESKDKITTFHNSDGGVIESTRDLNADTSPAGFITHCGVREFSAPPGRIGLPKKVIESISEKYSINSSLSSSGSDVNISGGDAQLEAAQLLTWPKIQIKYVRLPKCTYAKLQPKLHRFFDVGPVKRCLEENLRFHATLSEGDILTVWYRGNEHQLKVVELKPEWKGSLVNTDVEIDLELSEELQKHQQLQDQQPLADNVDKKDVQSSVVGAAGIASGKGFHTLNAAASSSASTSAAVEVSTAEASTTAEWVTKELEPEPQQADDITVLKIKLPNGLTKVRRFARSSCLRQVFLFVAREAHLNREQMQSQLVISTRFPKRNLRLSDSAAAVDEAGNIGEQRLGELGWTDANIAVMATLD